MKKFRTWYNTEIKEIETVCETAKYVTVENGRRLKHPDRATDEHYHNTWQEAHQFLIDREITAMNRLQSEITRHVETLQKLQEMSQP